MPPRADSLDPQAAALIEELDSGIAPPSSTLSVDTGRRLLEELFSVVDPEPVGETADVEIQGPNGPISLRIYAPDRDGPAPVLAFFHGGGWVRGSIDAYDGLCRRLTNRVGSVVVSVGYRRAPEHPFPAGLEDCYAATEWAATHAGDLGGDPDRVAVGGDSAGGNLAAAVALAARDRDGPDLSHQLLVYPAVNPPSVRWFESYDENGTGYFLEMDSVEWYLEQYCRPADVGNAYAFPLRARELSGLPAATVVTAGYDPLVEEGAAYADRLEAAGVEATRLHYPAQIHGFCSLYEHIDEGKAAIDDAAEAVRASL
jgi:acetyl esterase